MNERVGASLAENNRRIYPIGTATIFPGLTPDILLGIAANKKAVVLITNAMGSIGADLHPALQNLRDQNVPVFVLPDNAREQHGVVRIVEDWQSATERDGGIFLEKANVNTLQEVIKAIEEVLDEGKEGQELGEAIRVRFSYKPSEEKPVSRLGTPRGFRQFTKEVNRSLQQA